MPDPDGEQAHETWKSNFVRMTDCNFTIIQKSNGGLYNNNSKS